MKLKGLTLIELLVAISISLILIIASIPIIVRSTGRDALEDQAQITASFVERARNYALHPESEYASWYCVRRMGNSQLKIQRWNSEKGKYEDIEENLKLPSGFQFNETFTTAVFNVPRGNYGGATAQIEIEKTGINGGKILVSVESPGVISVGEIYQ